MKKEFIVKCKNCGKEFTVIEEETKFPIKGDKYFCCRSCANTRHHSLETKQKISKTIYNKIKSGETVGFSHLSNSYISKCIYCGKDIYYIGAKNFKRFCSKECKHNYLSERCGGIRNGAGIGKHGKYKGYYCDSTWELAFLIYHLDHNLFIQRYKGYRLYTFNDKIYKYYPDFVTDNGIFEIKGYKTEQSDAKHLQNMDIKILYKDDMKFYLDYIQNTYHTDIENLYDGPFD